MFAAKSYYSYMFLFFIFIFFCNLMCIYRFCLQGITSFGDGCGKRGKYGIYTRTAAYVPWMRAVISKKYYDD